MEQLVEAKKEAVRMHSPWGSNHICAIMEMMLEQALRNVMCNFSNEGLDIVLNLVEKEDVRLFSEDRTQFLREVLRLDSAGGNKIVAILLRMGAKLPDEEQPQFLKDALRMNSVAGNNHVHVLREMGAKLSMEQLAEAKEVAVRMNSPWGSNHICAIMEMMLEQALRNLLCNFNEGLDIVRNLVEKENVRLSSKQLTQLLREAFKTNSANGNNLVHFLVDMGAKLHEDEKPQFLHEALRMNSAAGNNHVHALREMGAKLSMEQLAEAKKEAVRMHSPWGSNHICAIMEMMLEQALRNVMCNFSKEGLDIVLNLVKNENVKLFSEDLTQFLREALRINSAGGNKIVAILLRMGCHTA